MYCFKMFGEIKDHSARDKNCLAFKHTLEKSRKNINYNGN